MHPALRGWVVLWALLGSSCLEADVSSCADLICPADQTCIAALGASLKSHYDQRETGAGAPADQDLGEAARRFAGAIQGAVDSLGARPISSRHCSIARVARISQARFTSFFAARARCLLRRAASSAY